MVSLQTRQASPRDVAALVPDVQDAECFAVVIDNVEDAERVAIQRPGAKFYASKEVREAGGTNARILGNEAACRNEFDFELFGNGQAAGFFVPIVCVRLPCPGLGEVAYFEFEHGYSLEKCGTSRKSESSSGENSPASASCTLARMRFSSALRGP